MAKILIVDERAQQRECLVGLLGQGAHCVMEAANAAEALGAMWAHRPDLVIVSNFPTAAVDDEFVRQLRADPALARTPVFFGTTQFREIFQENERRHHSEPSMECSGSESVTSPAGPDIQLLLNTTAEAIYAVDLEGTCTFCNPACVRLLGHDSAADLLGKNMHALTHPTRPDGSPFPLHQCHVHDHSRLIQDTHVLEEVFWRADGHRVPVEYWSRPLLHGCECIGAVCTFVELSGRKRWDQQDRQAQKMEAIARLAGGVAHGFNNLLTVIMGYSDIVAAKLPADDPSRASIEQVRKAVLRAGEITSQLLACSRKQVLVPSVLDLNVLLAGMEKPLANGVRDGIQIRVLPGPDLWKIKADRGRMEQVVSNIVANAVEAMPQGGIITIETANCPPDEAFALSHPESQASDHVLLAISDNGCGMDDATRERVFEPFFTTKGSEKGAGLGLATVYGTIQQSGGRVEIHSELGYGTNFLIYLPAVSEETAAITARGSGPGTRQGSETLLLVDDEEGIRSMARTVLEANGYKILDANNGYEALLISQLHEGTIHLMLTDVLMPRMNGQELARQVAPQRPDMKILFLSAYTDEAIADQGEIGAATAFLPKPFSANGLARKVREVLDAR